VLSRASCPFDRTWEKVTKSFAVAWSSLNCKATDSPRIYETKGDNALPYCLIGVQGPHAD